VASIHLINGLQSIDETPHQQAACQPSGKGISGQGAWSFAWLSLAARGGGSIRGEGWAKKSS